MHSKLRKVLAGVSTAALSLIGLSPLAAVSPAAATGSGSTIYFDSSYVDFEGASSTPVLLNSSSTPSQPQPTKALKTTMPTWSQPWAGTTLKILSSGEFVSSSTGVTVQARVYSPTIGARINLKLEDSSTYNPNTYQNSRVAEVSTLSTRVGWETLTFDFSAAVAANDAWNFDEVSIFFDFFPASRTQTIWYLTQLTYGDPNNLNTLSAGDPAAMDYTIRLASADKPAGSSFTAPSSWTSWNSNVGRQFIVRYLDAGAQLVLHYNVTDTNTQAPVAGVTVELNIETPDNNVTYTANSLTAVTDNNGDVSFTINNTNELWNAENVRSVGNTEAGFNARTLPEHRWSFEPTIAGLAWNTSSHVHADWLWGHLVSSSAGAPPCIPTATKVIRFLNPAMVPGQNAYDATGWVEPYITKGSKAYLQYLHAGDAMKLTYVVTNNCGTPFADQPVKLKINANWSCSNATFTADGKVIGPDYCNGNGETILAARNTNAAGFVTFDLTNTNNAATAEPTPSSPTSPPSAAVTAAKQEVKTNIQPYIDGTEVIDLYFAHFTRDPQVSLTAPASVVKGVRSKITMNLMGSNGAAAASTRVSFKVTGGGSVAGNTMVGSSSGNLYVVTDASGNASVNYLAGANDSGPVTVTASYTDAAGLTTSKSATFTLADPVVLTPTIKVTGGSGSVKINAVNAKGKSLTVVKAGSRKSYSYGVHGDNETFTLIAAPGNLSVTVFVDGKPQTFQVKVN